MTITRQRPIGERWPEWSDVPGESGAIEQKRGRIYDLVTRYNSLRAEAMRLEEKANSLETSLGTLTDLYEEKSESLNTLIAQNKALREFAESEITAAWHQERDSAETLKHATKLGLLLDGGPKLNPEIFSDA